MHLSLVQHASITLPVASKLLSWEMSQCLILTQGQMADLPSHTLAHMQFCYNHNNYYHSLMILLPHICSQVYSATAVVSQEMTYFLYRMHFPEQVKMKRK